MASAHRMHRAVESRRTASENVSPNWPPRLECTITGAVLTARDVLIQIAHEFGYGTATGARLQ